MFRNTAGFILQLLCISQDFGTAMSLCMQMYYILFQMSVWASKGVKGGLFPLDFET